MNLGLDGRICLVTGASAGIGRKTAETLAAEGAQLVLVARRAELLEELASQLTGSGYDEPMIIPADLTDGSEITRIRNQVLERFGRLDVLVNNAGKSDRWFREEVYITPETSSAWPAIGNAEVSEEAAWTGSFDINFTYVRRLTHAFLPTMINQRWGRVILVGGLPEPQGLCLAFAAKAAARAWAKGLSREVAPVGITVNSIPLGKIFSEQFYTVMYPTKEKQQTVLRRIPMGRFGEPEEVANVIAFLASELSSYVTGQGITVDGGMSQFAF